MSRRAIDLKGPQPAPAEPERRYTKARAYTTNALGERVDLGEVQVGVDYGDTRCTAALGFDRCALDTGHTGPHQCTDGDSWFDRWNQCAAIVNGVRCDVDVPVDQTLCMAHRGTSIPVRRMAARVPVSAELLSSLTSGVASVTGPLAAAVRAAADNEAEQVLRSHHERMVAEAAARAPVDTGQLRASLMGVPVVVSEQIAPGTVRIVNGPSGQRYVVHPRDHAELLAEQTHRAAGATRSCERCGRPTENARRTRCAECRSR